MSLDSISKTTARRYILGRQGLWPGRRWRGKAGTARALQYIEAVQIDPLTVVARSHDLVLHSRVVDYRPDQLDCLLYHDRKFFDYGGAVFIYPMDELPYWQMAMQRKGAEARWARFATQHAALLEEVRRELRARGPLGNRDFTGQASVNSYRAGKNTGLALYYLWLTGELMTHHRQGFERKFDFREHVAPASVDYAAMPDEAEDFLARKTIAFRGLSTAREWAHSFAGTIERRVSREEARRRLDELVDAGEVAAIKVEGREEPCYLRAADRPVLATLEAGRVPRAWQPIDTTTQVEVVFLAPLDIVSARGRASILFDFDYIWEVYKPAAARRWGYYTLPILYGDRLVARLDPKLDRETETLVINGFWLEDETLADDSAFIAALARGLNRFADFLSSRRIDLSALRSRSRRPLAAERKAAQLLQERIIH